jgi:hypothetical protein
VSPGRPPDTYEGSELYLTLGTIIDDDGAALFLAQVDGQPVGRAEAYIRQGDPNQETCLTGQESLTDLGKSWYTAVARGRFILSVMKV